MSSLNLQTAPGGRILTDPESLATSRPGVYAGGDCTLGPATFVQAVAQGRQAALSIHSFLAYGALQEVKPKERPVPKELLEPERLRARPIPRHEMPMLSPDVEKDLFRANRTGVYSGNGTG